jgi:organic hydroperoxide reductase OsmC/OhrA
MAEFKLQLAWSGSTAADYSRNAVASTNGKTDIGVSAGSAYGGDDSQWNPEDLLGTSLSTCHMLTFLALCKKIGVDVRRYNDDVTVTLGVVDKASKVTKIRLAATIVISATSDVAKAEELFHKAHKFCFIGNSITSEVELLPSITRES